MEMEQRQRNTRRDKNKGSCKYSKKLSNSISSYKETIEAMEMDKKTAKINQKHKNMTNIRIKKSISDKEKELVEEFEKTDLDILGITETKKKGTGELELQSGHILIYSGVQHTSRAREGVGCIIKRKKQNT
ncbi:hypothetical protein RN001_001306 [Aquatica leii]|uniref:Uncharacterized protein n=1 Tax=Aquatica leii TaxID=1421715 RepID=A0AAN7QAA3_9COLE|nr:hypothetical protein RN001_001306 [Aquatica leii]